MAVEIVVSHDLDDETTVRYAKDKVPVFILRPTWETVGQLRHELVADEALFVQSNKCPTCRVQLEVERRHEQRLDHLRARLAETLLVDDRIVEQRLGDWPPEVDRFGRSLYPSVRRLVADQAIRLMMVGFTQLPRNRWVFVLHLPDRLGAVYAGLGGTEWDPLWSSPMPEFWFHLSVEAAVQERYGEVVVAFLERHGLRIGEQWLWNLRHSAYNAALYTTGAVAAP